MRAHHGVRLAEEARTVTACRRSYLHPRLDLPEYRRAPLLINLIVDDGFPDYYDDYYHPQVHSLEFEERARDLYYALRRPWPRSAINGWRRL